MKIKLDGRILEVDRAKYVKAKANQLREFGYTDLTDTEVDAQIDAVLSGKDYKTGKTIIGGFMEDEVIEL